MHGTTNIKFSQLMLYGETIAVRSEIHTKCINILCGQNVGFLRLKVYDSLLAVLRSIADIKEFVFTPLYSQLLEYELKRNSYFYHSSKCKLWPSRKRQHAHKVPVFIEKLQVPE